MLNILSYLGMSVQSEVCLWTLLGILRTIFDATLFKVNANLKQVWQMTMPRELTLPVQRMLRTMISGVMLVQCFTLYVYLAAFIVLLYPVFLEERPNLVLPWLLLAAIRNLLCELMNIAMGLGVCVLLGPARPPCIRFVVIKVVSIMPAFYMWMLMFSYYHSLKNSWSYKSFAPVHNTEASDFGLELAVRRRRTKSLLDEDQLRKKMITNFYNEESIPALVTLPSSTVFSSDTSTIPSSDNIEPLKNIQMPNSVASNRLLADFAVDMDGTDLVVARNADRILEQFIMMMLKIGSFLNKKGIDPVKLLNSPSLTEVSPKNYSDKYLSSITPQNAVTTQNESTKESTPTICCTRNCKLDSEDNPQPSFQQRIPDSASVLLDTDKDKTPTIPIYRNMNIGQPQNKPLDFTKRNRALIAQRSEENIPQSKNKYERFVSHTHTKITHTERTGSRSPVKDLDHSSKVSNCKKIGYNETPSQSKHFQQRAGVDTRKLKTITTTKVTKTRSITITPPPPGLKQVPEKEETKHGAHKHCTGNTSTCSRSNTNVSLCRASSHEAREPSSANKEKKLKK